jgi:hypothetical protein
VDETGGAVRRGTSSLNPRSSETLPRLLIHA